GASKRVNVAADAAHLAEVKFVVLVETERREAGVIRAGVRAGTGWHDAKEDFSRRAGGFIEDPDLLLYVVAEDVFAGQIRSKEATMIDVATNDSLAFAVGVIENRTFVDADVRWSEIALQTLDHVPLKIEPRTVTRFDDIEFFA